ncbi:MAG: hypothetical protein DMD72_05830 [Gemmatimonadetes bacterium]|nr:MAG: hypothetical protein DMD72_05830 [Gemmatimonadota bacterium]
MGHHPGADAQRSLQAGLYQAAWKSRDDWQPGSGGISPNNFGNPDLKWEQTREVDAGFDWTMFDGRIGLVGDYYKKKTSNLLVSRPISATSGFTSFTDNNGTSRTAGSSWR